MKQLKFRFAVGRPDGPQSSVWSVFTRAGKNDVYVANRSIASSLKVSLHESGIWRLAFTEPYAADLRASGQEVGDRVQHRWLRPIEAQPGWTHAVNVVIPVSDLRDYGKLIDYGKEIYWRSAPGPGMECVFGVFLVRPGSPRPLLRPAWETLSVFVLPNGDELHVIVVDAQTAPQQVVAYDQWRSTVRKVSGPGYRSMLFGGSDEGTRIMVDLYSGDE